MVWKLCLYVMPSVCPYCSLATKTGELYCSIHSADMHSLKSGVFLIAGKKFEECDWHVTRLSLNFNLDDEQIYFAGKRKFRIAPNRLLLISEGQSFKTQSHNNLSRMLTVAYEVGLPGQIWQNLMHTHEALIERWPDSHLEVIGDQTVEFTQEISQQLNDVMNRTSDDSEGLQENIEALLTAVLSAELQKQKKFKIDRTRESTRKELLIRVARAAEYARASYDTPMCVEEMAAEACLSLFHFKRVFKEVYQVAPYEYVRSLRLARAVTLLGRQMPVNEVCRAVGWTDPSSFNKLFKDRFGKTPSCFAQTPRRQTS